MPASSTRSASACTPPTTSSSATAWRTPRALGRLGRHLPVVVAGLRHRAQPDSRKQGGLRLPRAVAHHAADRSPARARAKEPIWNHDEIIRNNIFAANRDAQVWGWFDTDDGRQWPAASPLRKSPENQGLSLETLHITFASNLYDPPPGQPFFRWGVDWKPNKAYATLDEVRRELNLEQGGRVAPLVVKDDLTRDLRVPPDSPALALGLTRKATFPAFAWACSSRPPGLGEASKLSLQRTKIPSVALEANRRKIA